MTTEKKMSLYELSEAGFAIRNLIQDAETTDRETFEAGLRNIDAQRMTKLQNIRHILLETKYLIEAADTEAKRVKAIKDTLSNRFEWLKLYALNDMIVNNEDELTFNGIEQLKVANNPPSVEVVNESDIPANFIRIVTETSINKAGILEHYKTTGREVPGIHIVTDKKSLRVK